MIDALEVRPEPTTGITPDMTYSTPGLLRRLTRNPLGIISSAITLGFIITGIVGLVIILVPSLHGNYLTQNLIVSLQSPLSTGHILGTDALGRDMAWRLVAGIGVSFGITLLVSAGAIAIGIPLGLISGYSGGATDTAIGGLADLVWGFPAILLAVVLTGVFQPGLTVVVLSLVLIQWAAFARVVRAQTLSIRERDFVKASRILGRSSGYIMWRHVLPNVLGPVLVMLSYFAPVVIITEAGLSFIGLGAQPPTPSLGQMLADGQNYFTADQWMIVLPALVLAVIAMGLNTFGDALRDALDPQGL